MMLRHTTIAVTTRALCVALGIVGAVPAIAADIQPPPDAVPLLAVELLSIYGNRTWQWGESGGAYFDTEGRRFVAYSVKESGKTTAIGKWRITDKGKLCFDADWVSASGRYPVTSCFEHVAAGDEIYQRSMPDGKWIVFRHAPVEPADEFTKLVHEDLVSANLDNDQQ